MTYKEKLGEAVVKTASAIYAFVANLPANTGRIDGDDPTITVEYYKDDAEFHVEYFSTKTTPPIGSCGTLEVIF